MFVWIYTRTKLRGGFSWLCWLQCACEVGNGAKDRYLRVVFCHAVRMYEVEEIKFHGWTVVDYLIGVCVFRRGYGENVIFCERC
jgi:hypothetical protein